MRNEELLELMHEREEEQAKLKEAVQGLRGTSPFALLSGGGKEQVQVGTGCLERVLEINNQIILELVERVIKNGD